MQPTTTVIRAISAELARRMVRPIIIVGAVFMAALVALGGWLASQNAWWWFLEIPFIAIGLLFLAAIVALHGMLRAVTPPLSRTQKQAVSSFVDKLERVAQHVQMPQIAVIYYVVREAIHTRRDGFIESVSRDSTSLAPEFLRLRKKFE